MNLLENIFFLIVIKSTVGLVSLSLDFIYYLHFWVTHFYSHFDNDSYYAVNYVSSTMCDFLYTSWVAARDEALDAHTINVFSKKLIKKENTWLTNISIYNTIPYVGMYVAM